MGEEQPCAAQREGRPLPEDGTHQEGAVGEASELAVCGRAGCSPVDRSPLAQKHHQNGDCDRSPQRGAIDVGDVGCFMTTAARAASWADEGVLLSPPSANSDPPGSAEEEDEHEEEEAEETASSSTEKTLE